MNTGKTNYRFQINCDPQRVSNIITEWLKENDFAFVNKYGENLYYCKDAVYGSRGFQCTMINHEVNIYAWTIGLGNKFYMLDSGAINNMCGDYYKSILSNLFDRLNALNYGNSGAYYNRNATQQPTGYTVSQAANDLNREVSTKAEKTCVAGFWISIAGLLLSFFGVAFGVIIYILVFSFAIQGLKTRKRKLAITSIVLTSISILVTILGLISSVL